MQKVLRDTIKPEGFEYLFSPTGQEGIETARKEKPDLVLLDIHLPDMSGMEVCRSLKSDARTRHIPVLMLTGKAWEVSRRVQGLDLGAEDYLLKPISPRVLVSRIRAILKLATKPT
ncbi:MAG: response regulator [Elusimicrobia bacterium]|nr:response regulator [Elusimicrobiota bacterium]